MNLKVRYRLVTISVTINNYLTTELARLHQL